MSNLKKVESQKNVLKKSRLKCEIANFENEEYQWNPLLIAKRFFVSVFKSKFLRVSFILSKGSR